MDLIEAARMGDAVGHTSAFWGFVAGAIIGVALGVLIAVTLPVSGPLLAAAVIGGGMAMGGYGAIKGMEWGLTQKHDDPIKTGAMTVFIGTDVKRAARATIDTLTCHSGEKIAQGSLTVFIEGGPAARRTDMTECGGTIEGGWPSVFIGKEAGTYMEIQPEVSEDMIWWANAAMIVGGVISMGVSLVAFGVLVTGVGFVINAVAAPVGKWIGGEVGSIWGPGGRVIGEAIGEQGLPFVAGMPMGRVNQRLTALEARGARFALARNPSLAARLARTPGTNPLQIGARQNVANDFYLSTNAVRPGQTPEAYRASIDSHMSGINYNRPVYVDAVAPNTQLNNWGAPGATRPGSYFAAEPTAPSELGIAQNITAPDGTTVPRELYTLQTGQSTEALYSTSAPKLDDWSVTGSVAESTGGADQIYIPRSNQDGLFQPNSSGNGVLEPTGQTSADFSTPGVNQNSNQTPPTHPHVPIAGDSGVLPGNAGPWG